MARPYLIGAGVLSDDLHTFDGLCTLHAEGRLDHIQVMLIPAATAPFQRTMEHIASAAVPVILHAPHHAQAVNPCDPGMFAHKTEGDIGRWIEHAMAQTFEAADILESPLVVLHAGVYREGSKERAIVTFREFLDAWTDPRLIVENMPAAYKRWRLLGSTAGELASMCTPKVRGYCLDFAHLYCTCNLCGMDFAAELRKFADLPVRLNHLSNSIKRSTVDEHLPLDHPDGGIDFEEVIRWIRHHPRIHTSLEFKFNDPRVYEDQLRVFDGLYRRYRTI